MSFLLNSQDLKDKKITFLLMKNTKNNEAPLAHKKSSKLLDNNEINRYINRCKKKKCTICPSTLSLNSSVQSTLNTLQSISLKDNSKLNKFFKDLSLTSSSNHTDRFKNITKLPKPKNEDMKILYKIFFNYDSESTLNVSMISEKNEYKNKNKSKYDLNMLRNYLIKCQTEFNEGGDILIIKTERSIPFLIDYYIMKKLEDLIARYCLIIFLFIKSNSLIEAKKIFLLMIKENIRFFNYIENKIFFSLNSKDKNKFQSKDNYNLIYQLTKIYSVIIRYSRLFNVIKYRNKFTGKYFKLMNISYHFFEGLSNYHNLNSEIKNQIISWFSYYISYVNYFSILNYSSFSIPVTLNNIILTLYKDSDESLFTMKEKRLLLNTQYNQGLLLYIINQKDEALFCLYQGQQKMKLLDNKIKYQKKDFLTPINRNGAVNSSNTSLKIVPYFDIKEKKKKFSYKSNIPIQLWKKIKPSEKNGFFSNKALDLMKSTKFTKSRYSIYEDIENICKNFFNSTINISDIILLIEYGIEKGKLNSKELYNLDKRVFCVFQKSESTNIGKAIRNSQIISSKTKNLELYFPKYLIDPLFFKFELLMGEIEINKKNIKAAYNHVLRTLFILVLLKFLKQTKDQSEDAKIQRVLNEHLKKLDELCEEQLIKSNQNESDSQIYSNGQVFFNLNNNFEETKKNKNEITVIKEFEKFFIFLSSLSIYQMKILNETQPENRKRNDLPIYFSSQFKDCLSTIQRIQLYELQTMALSRFIILKNPNKWIIPSNLNTNLLNSIHNNTSLKSKITLNYLTQLKSSKKYTLGDFKKDYNNYKKIILSKKVTSKMKDFLNKNIELALKILKNSSNDEVKYMMSNPLLLVKPIKKYVNKSQKKLNIEINENANIFLGNYNNRNKNISKLEFRKTTKPTRYSINTRLSNPDFLINKKKYLIEKKTNVNKNRRRNKSTGNILINQSIIDNINQCNFINDLKGTKDYNDSFEDYKLSIDCSFYE